MARSTRRRNNGNNSTRRPARAQSTGLSSSLSSSSGATQASIQRERANALALRRAQAARISSQLNKSRTMRSALRSGANLSKENVTRSKTATQLSTIGSLSRDSSRKDAKKNNSRNIVSNSKAATISDTTRNSMHCKERPTAEQSFRGNGGSRPFVPWRGTKKGC